MVLRPQDGVAELLAGLGDGAVEVPVREVNGRFMQPRDNEEDADRDGEPGPARQGEAFAHPFAHMPDLLV